MPLVPFIGPTYTSRSRSVNAQRTVNLYPEVDPTGTAKGQQNAVAALYGTPGMRYRLAAPGTGPLRGLYTSSQGTLYAVQAGWWYRWDLDLQWVPIGALQTMTGPVSHADNGTQVCMVDGPYGYIYTESTQTFGQITDPDFLGSNRVAYIDGYFCFAQPGTQRFYISELLDGRAYDSLNFASAEAYPDTLVSLGTNQREIWLFGETTTEIWYDAGLADFPFTRVQGAILEVGCEAPLSVASIDGELAWLGQTENGGGIVYRLNGYQAERISTHAVETALTTILRSDATAFGYSQAGHAFYVLTFPTAQQTWVYDFATQLWHERSSRREDGIMQAWSARYGTYWRGHLLVGVENTGKLYTLDLDYYTEDGAVIPRIRTSPHYSGQELAWHKYVRFQLDLETGQGLDGGTEPGVTPQVMLQWSDDGGFTWSHEYWVTSGALGNYRARARWNRLGQARDRIFRVTITDPVKIALIGATMLTQEGTS